MVQQLPEKDRYSITRQQMMSRLIVAMGGRVAEEMKFGYDAVTSGASGDIQMATNLARSMVTEFSYQVLAVTSIGRWSSTRSPFFQLRLTMAIRPPSAC